jgi:hypothetical protein
MAMQTDVRAAHVNNTGLLVSGRTRLKSLVYCGTAGQAGVLNLFDTLTAPVSGTYARSGTTVTVTKSAHGLATGATLGFAFGTASGSSATNGNYVITVVDANTFTITDVTSGTIAGGTTMMYSTGAWVASFDTLTGATGSQQVLIPGEGVLVSTGVFASLTNVTFVTVFYG